jgi:hypothetical protein
LVQQDGIYLINVGSTSSKLNGDAAQDAAKTLISYCQREPQQIYSLVGAFVYSEQESVSFISLCITLAITYHMSNMRTYNNYTINVKL